MIISYGLKYIFPALVLAIAAVLWGASRNSLLLFLAAAFLTMLTLFLAFFYRNPVRHIPADNSLILSPADGRVLAVEDIQNEYIGGKGKKVSIFLSVFDVHVNRIPVTGKIDYVKYNPGKFHLAYLDKASTENESNEIGMKFSGGKMIFKQIAGTVARRIESTAQVQMEFDGGQIYGMIHFGSRAELYLPDNVDISVKAGDRVAGGSSIIGKIR